MKRRHRWRPLDSDQLRQVRGAVSILLPALAQAKQPVRTELEEVTIACEELVRQL